MAYAVSPDYRSQSTASSNKGPDVKLTARIGEGSHIKGEGYLLFEKHKVFVSRDDFVAEHKRPEVGDIVEFRIGRDEQGRVHAVQVEHHNEGGRIRLWHVLILVPLLAAPCYALWEMADRNDWRLVVGCGLGMSIIGYLVYWLDKLRARHGQWRVAESTLHLVAACGGWPGAFLAQKHFRHKTGKLRFQLIFWLIITIHQFIAVDYLRDWTAARQANEAFMRYTMPAPAGK